MGCGGLGSQLARVWQLFFPNPIEPYHCDSLRPNPRTTSLFAIEAVAAMGAKRAKEKNKKAERPTFDEAALAHLTSKIDKSLANSKKQAPVKRKRQRDNDDGPDSKRRQTSPVVPKPKGAHGEERKNKQLSLLDEILALGGDEADLELVANVDSGNEDGDAPKFKIPAADTLVDKALKDELTQFASSLGFHKFHQDEQDPATDDSDGTEDTSSSGPEEDNEEEEEITEGGYPTQGIRESKQSGKLVSRHPGGVVGSLEESRIPF